MRSFGKESTPPREKRRKGDVLGPNPEAFLAAQSSGGGRKTLRTLGFTRGMNMRGRKFKTVKMVPEGRIELPTRGFSIPCSTTELLGQLIGTIRVESL